MHWLIIFIAKTQSEFDRKKLQQFVRVEKLLDKQID